jgi:MFS family permease
MADDHLSDQGSAPGTARGITLAAAKEEETDIIDWGILQGSATDGKTVEALNSTDRLTEPTLVLVDRQTVVGGSIRRENVSVAEVPQVTRLEKSDVHGEAKGKENTPAGKEQNSNGGLSRIGGSQAPTTPTPVPWKKIAALVVVALNEAICSNMLFPFVGFLVAKLTHKTDLSEAGYASGLLIAMFQFAQFCFCKRWGYLSDRYGRRLIMQAGLLLSAAAVVLFGFSFSLWWAMIIRFLHGAANGNVVVAKTVIADITDHTNQALGFAALSASWGLGALIGPAIGGILYDPTTNEHLSFLGLDPKGLFAEYPALLPCLVMAAYSLIAFCFSVMWLPETNLAAKPPTLGDLCGCCMKSENAEEASIDSEGNTTVRRKALEPAEGSPQAPSPFGFKEAFQTPSVRNAILLYCGIAATDFVWGECFPLWAMTRRRRGGLRMNSESIGLIAVVNGIYSIIANITFPSFRRRFPNKYRHWRVTQLIWGSILFTIPFISHIPDQDRTEMLILMQVLMFVRGMAASHAFGLVFIFVAESGPREHCGAITGIAQAVTAAVRTIVPILAAPLFAASVLHTVEPVFDHHAVFYVCFLLTIGTALFSYRAEREAQYSSLPKGDDGEEGAAEFGSPTHPAPDMDLEMI